MTQLAPHNDSSDCWVSYFDQVYDLTQYAPRHPRVGPGVINQDCGQDGTASFSNVHPKSLLSIVADTIVGTLHSESAASCATNDSSEEDARNSSSTGSAIAMAELQTHDMVDNCWVAYYDSVYDLTEYADRHAKPPGKSVIFMAYDQDGTVDYASFHPPEYLNALRGMIVGDFARSNAHGVCSWLATLMTAVLVVLVGLL